MAGYLLHVWIDDELARKPTRLPLPLLPRSTFVLAGRDRRKLEALAAELDVSPAPAIVVADVAQPDSLAAMARAGRVLINTVGPFRCGRPQRGPCRVHGSPLSCRRPPPGWQLHHHHHHTSNTDTSALPLHTAHLAVPPPSAARYWGEPVFKACVEAGTDYLDVCGEPGERLLGGPQLQRQ